MSDIQSVKRAFTILNIVANYPDGISLAEMTDVVDLPKSTVARMLSTLESLETVERVPDGDGFRLGPATAALIWQPYYLQTIIRPYMEQLAEATGETVSLALPENDQIHYIDQIECRFDIQMRDFTGYRIPDLHAYSPGKILLAHWPEARLKHYLNQPLTQFTPHTITNPTNLQEQLNDVQARGYAWASDESELGLVGLSAPIYNTSHNLVAMINIYGPVFRFPPIHPESALTQKIIDIAETISENLSGQRGRTEITGPTKGT